MSAQPGTVRPGGRTARVRTAVLRAAGDLLAEQGFDRLDLTEVARRAEVGKTTVYRRWGTAGALVADLLTDLLADASEEPAPRTRTRPHLRSRSLREDLRTHATQIQRTLANPRQAALFRAVIAAAAGDDRTAEALRHFHAVRVAEWTPCVVAAVTRGELPPGTDPATVVRAVSAPLHYGLLTTGAPPSPAMADRAADAAVAAAKAGVYVIQA